MRGLLLRGLLLLLMSALAGYPAGTSALSTDREQPVRVDADRAQLDDQRRVAVYTGNVVLHQGSLRIAGDVLTMRFDERYDLSTLVAEGGPAHFRQQLDSGAAQNGWARRIEYRQVTGAMIFIGAARITQGQFEMKAHRIDYDSVNGSIEGMSAEGGSEEERVMITVRSAPGQSR